MENRQRKLARERGYRTAAKQDLTLFLIQSLRFKRYHAKKKGIPFDLDEEWVLKQPKMCAISGEMFEIPPSGTGPRTPSFDQKTPGGGYTKENTQLICLWLNQAFGQWPKDQVHALMDRLTEVRNAQKPALLRPGR